MKKYTLEDFKKFERNKFGYIICPSGDYTQIKEFPACCSFENWCDFDEHCSFGKECNFGKWCYFGENCLFYYGCNFGDWCDFGSGCRFGEDCDFGNENRFREGCHFGVGCYFGETCIFYPGCTVEDGKELKNYTKIEGTGSERRCTYFYQLTDGSIYVRCGCFAGYEDEFLSAVKETHEGTVYERQYHLALELAKLTF